MQRNTSRAVGVLILFLLVAPAAAQEPEPRVLRDNWYAAYMNGQKVGHSHEKTVELEVAEGTRYETNMQQEVSLRRGQQRLRIVTEARIVEDEDGRLVEFEQTQKQGPTAQTTRGRVEGGELVLSVGAAGSERRMRLPAPEGLCPHGLHKLQQRKGHRPGTSYSVRVFSPEFAGQTVTARVEIGGREAVNVFDVSKELQRVETTLSVLPGMVVTEWVDDTGTAVLARMPLAPGVEVEVRLTTREVAMAPADQVDVMSLAVISPRGVVERPRRTDRARLRLTAGEGQEELPEVPTGPYQEVEEGANGLVLTITRAPVPSRGGYSMPYEEDDLAPLLRANRWLEADEPSIRQMAREAVGEEDDPARAAGLIEAYVAEHIEQKDLSLGMATAAEAARQRTGDCTEHAMLAAALARAVGIPSRVVTGVAYVRTATQGGVFAYHSWAELFMGEWLPVDPALGGHDATHIAFTRTDLNSPGSLSDMTSFIPFVGRIDIEILDVQYGVEGRQAPGSSTVAPQGVSDLQSEPSRGR